MDIIFVNHKPTNKPVIKRLRKWIVMISTELAVYNIAPQFKYTNSHTKKELDKIKDLCTNSESYLIVTLGQSATKQVTSKLSLRVWKLVHPNNKPWNEHEYEVAQIKLLTGYIIANEKK